MPQTQRLQRPQYTSRSSETTKQRREISQGMQRCSGSKLVTSETKTKQ